MSFQLCPDDGLPRLWRFVAHGVLPPGVVATLDKAQNLLVIDKAIYDRLTPTEKHMLLRTSQARTKYTFDMLAMPQMAAE